MSTTIQIGEHTLKILKKIKDETQSSSYDEAINKLVVDRIKKVSLAGYLGGKPMKEILNGLRDKNERF